jgi:hypothetical protein
MQVGARFARIVGGGREQTEASRPPNARTTRADWSSSCLSSFPQKATCAVCRTLLTSLADAEPSITFSRNHAEYEHIV